jgi:hypothetical protein
VFENTFINPRGYYCQNTLTNTIPSIVVLFGLELVESFEIRVCVVTSLYMFNFGSPADKNIMEVTNTRRLQTTL